MKQFDIQLRMSGMHAIKQRPKGFQRGVFSFMAKRRGGGGVGGRSSGFRVY